MPSALEGIFAFVADKICSFFALILFGKDLIKKLIKQYSDFGDYYNRFQMPKCPVTLDFF